MNNGKFRRMYNRDFVYNHHLFVFCASSLNPRSSILIFTTRCVGMGGYVGFSYFNVFVSVATPNMQRNHYFMSHMSLLGAGTWIHAMVPRIHGQDLARDVQSNTPVIHMVRFGVISSPNNDEQVHSTARRGHSVGPWAISMVFEKCITGILWIWSI